MKKFSLFLVLFSIVSYFGILKAIENNDERVSISKILEGKYAIPTTEKEKGTVLVNKDEALKKADESSDQAGDVLKDLKELQSYQSAEGDPVDMPKEIAKKHGLDFSDETSTKASIHKKEIEKKMKELTQKAHDHLETAKHLRKAAKKKVPDYDLILWD